MSFRNINRKLIYTERKLRIRKKNLESGRELTSGKKLRTGFQGREKEKQLSDKVNNQAGQVLESKNMSR